MQLPSNVGDDHGSVMKGWFVAPATTNYRFYMSCDDSCRLNLGNTPNNAEDTTEINYNGEVSKIIPKPDFNDVRNFWDVLEYESNPTTISDWIALEKGEHYFIEGHHLEWRYADHFSVAVEIEATSEVAEGHHQSMKEIQKLTV